MDIQIKLSVDINNGYSSKISSLEINNSTQQSTLFEFKEYSTVKIKLLNDDMNEEVKIKIETSKEIEVITQNNRIAVISSFPEKSFLVPGKYKMIIYSGEKRLDCFFKVVPQSLEWDELKDMRIYLEKMQKDLSKNLFSKKRISDINDIGGVSNYNIHNYLIENKELLHLNLSNILENPLFQISKEYDFYMQSKKPDNKTYKKYVQKGINIYQNMSNIKHYERRICKNYNIPENRWLFQVILKLIQMIKDIEAGIIKNEIKIKSKMELLNEMLDKCTEKMNKITNNNYISEEYKRKISTSSFVTKKEICEYTAIIEKLQFMRVELKSVSQQLNQTLQKEVFLMITDINKPMKNSLKIIKDRRYSWIYKFYNDIKEFNSGEKESRATYYEFKPTYELFEYYNFVIVIEVLLSMGFEWCEGWLADEMEMKEELLKGSRLKFARGNESIYLDYDREINYNSVEKSEFVAINSKNRKPDILLSYFNNEKIKGAIVFEVKYRKSGWLYNVNGDTEVLEQMKNYLQLGYYDIEQKKLIRQVVNKVITLYPTQDKLVKFKDCIYKDVLSYIDIKPSVNKEEIVAYHEIRNIIEDIITENRI